MPTRTRREIAFLPIGDHYTMGPEAAARACQLLLIRQVVPMHYGTFPILTGTPERLKALVEPMGVDVLVLKPGETARVMLSQLKLSCCSNVRK